MSATTAVRYSPAERTRIRSPYSRPRARSVSPCSTTSERLRRVNSDSSVSMSSMITLPCPPGLAVPGCLTLLIVSGYARFGDFCPIPVYTVCPILGPHPDISCEEGIQDDKTSLVTTPLRVFLLDDH